MEEQGGGLGKEELCSVSLFSSHLILSSLFAHIHLTFVSGDLEERETTQNLLYTFSLHISIFHTHHFHSFPSPQESRGLQGAVGEGSSISYTGVGGWREALAFFYPSSWPPPMLSSLNLLLMPCFYEFLGTRTRMTVT